MKKIIIIAAITLVLVIGIFFGCRTLRSNNNNISPLKTANEQELSGRRLEISFSYANVRMIASSQFAFWIEDIDGNYVDTLYVTQWTAQGGYRRRPTSISQWVTAAGLANMQQSEIDTISGATPQPGDYLVSWDFTDRNGNFVTGTQYHYFIEATMNFNEHVLFTGVITIGESLAYNPTPIFNPPDTRFHNMITNVRVTYYPD
jgi:hypothetical protein